MKTSLVLLFAFAAFAAQAQPTNAPPAQARATNAPWAQAQPTNAPPAHTEESVEAHAAQRVQEAVLVLKAPKPNEIVRTNLTYSGILVQAVKTRNPLQLLNPLAPAEYGAAEDNLVRDPINGRASGLKFFAIQF